MSDSTTLINGDARHAARSAWLFAFAEGDDLSGAKLGEMFHKSRSWGRDRRAEGRSWLAALPTDMPTESESLPSDASVMPAERAPEPTDAERHEDVNPQPMADVLMRFATVAAVSIVAAVAAVMSYMHMLHVARDAGEGGMAWLLPFSVDGLVVAASMVAVSSKRANRPVGVLPWACIVLGLLASLAANIAAADPTVVGRVVAAWPPLALGLSFELLLRRGHDS